VNKAGGHLNLRSEEHHHLQPSPLMLLHGVKDTDSELFLGMLVGAVYSPIIPQIKPPLTLPMDSRLMPLSQAKADVAQLRVCFMM
jgi:hypothetical protein